MPLPSPPSPRDHYSIGITSQMSSKRGWKFEVLGSVCEEVARCLRKYRTWTCHTDVVALTWLVSFGTNLHPTDSIPSIWLMSMAYLWYNWYSGKLKIWSPTSWMLSILFRDGRSLSREQGRVILPSLTFHMLTYSIFLSGIHCSEKICFSCPPEILFQDNESPSCEWRWVILALYRCSIHWTLPFSS